MNIVQAGGTYRADFAVQSSTGAAANADSLPTAAAYRNGAVDAAVTVTVANITTGAYTLSFAVPVGYAAGDFVRALVTAVVGGVTVVGWSHVLTVAGFPATALPNAAAGTSGGVPLVGSAPLTNLDAAVSSRSTYAGGDTSGTTTLLSRLTSTRAGLLDNLDAAVSTRSVYAGADTPGTTTLLSRVTGAVLLASAYTAPPSAAAITSAVAAQITTDHGAGDYTASGGGGLDAAGVRDAVGLALPNLDELLDLISATTVKLDTTLEPDNAAWRFTAASLVMAPTGVTVSGSVAVVGPVALSGDIALIRGDSYHAADGRALEWASGGSWPDLTGAALALTLFEPGGPVIRGAGTVVTPSGSGQKVRVELTSAETRAISHPGPGGTIPFHLTAARSNGHVVGLVSGKAQVSNS